MYFPTNNTLDLAFDLQAGQAQHFPFTGNSYWYGPGLDGSSNLKLVKEVVHYFPTLNWRQRDLPARVLPKYRIAFPEERVYSL